MCTKPILMCIYKCAPYESNQRSPFSPKIFYIGNKVVIWGVRNKTSAYIWSFFLQKAFSRSESREVKNKFLIFSCTPFSYKKFCTIIS